MCNQPCMMVCTRHPFVQISTDCDKYMLLLFIFVCKLNKVSSELLLVAIGVPTESALYRQWIPFSDVLYFIVYRCCWRKFHIQIVGWYDLAVPYTTQSRVLARTPACCTGFDMTINKTQPRGFYNCWSLVERLCTSTHWHPVQSLTCTSSFENKISSDISCTYPLENVVYLTSNSHSFRIIKINFLLIAIS